MQLSLDDATAPRLRWPEPRQLYWLAGIAAVGLVLRLIGLQHWGFWVDEAHTYRDAVSPFDTFETQNRSRYPLSFYLLRVLLELMPNDSEGWVRLPFAFFGAITIPIMGFLMTPVAGARAALVAAGLLAINPWHIYWSQNARFYSLTSLLAVVAVGLVYQGVVLRRASRVAWGVTAALLGGLSHLPVFALLPALLAGWWLGREREHVGPDRRLAIVCGVTVLCVLVFPWMLPRLPGLDIFIKAKGEASLLHLFQTSAYYFRIPLILTSLVGAWFLWRQNRMSASVLAAWVVIPALVLVAAGTVVKTTSRYVFFAQPAVLLLCGVAVVRIWDVLMKALEPGGGRGRMLVAGLLPALLLADSLAADYLYFAQEHGDRPRWGEAARLVEREAGARPTIVVTTNTPTMRYYLDRRVFRMGSEGSGLHRIVPVLEWELAQASGDGAGFLDKWLAEAEASDSELFVVSMQPELEEKDRKGGLVAALRREFRVVGTFRNHVGPRDLTVYVYRPSTDR